MKVQTCKIFARIVLLSFFLSGCAPFGEERKYATIVDDPVQVAALLTWADDFIFAMAPRVEELTIMGGFVGPGAWLLLRPDATAALPEAQSSLRIRVIMDDKSGSADGVFIGRRSYCGIVISREGMSLSDILIREKIRQNEIFATTERAVAICRDRR